MQFLAELKRGDIDVVVSTEQTVRGLDYCFVDTVFLMEVPRKAQEYVHLAGRMGRRGSVVVMVGDNDPRNSTRLRRIHTQLGVETVIMYNDIHILFISTPTQRLATIMFCDMLASHLVL